MMDGILAVSPEDFNSLSDIIQYAWVALLYYGKRMVDKIKELELKLSSPAKESALEAKIDRLEAILLAKQSKPFDLGEK